MGDTALRLVDRVGFSIQEMELRLDGCQGESHSLHYLLSYPEQSDPELIRYLLDYTTKSGQYVLDPFCGIGTIGLESALMSRIPVLSDLNPLSVDIARAVLLPADISEITLKLQLIPFTRPINAKLHDKNFEPFFDLRTFCELYNLRQQLLNAKTGSDLFLKIIAVSLLHGQSSGYFSVYTNPQVSLSPEDQLELNRRRKQVADYRAVAPRILRKVASVLRDGIPSAMRKAVNQGALKIADARNLKHVPTGSIDAVITSPPIPYSKDCTRELWLKRWFCGYPFEETDLEESESGLLTDADLNSWLEFMNESLLELARATRSNARASLVLAEQPIDNQVVCLASTLKALIGENLSKYWEVETLLINKPVGEIIGSQVRPRNNSKITRDRVLLLRRK